VEFAIDQINYGSDKQRKEKASRRMALPVGNDDPTKADDHYCERSQWNRFGFKKQSAAIHPFKGNVKAH
jgi:hypothetical protein